MSIHESSPKYCYKPLRHSLGDEIRLIVLYAGEWVDDLICEIVVVNLMDRPAYEAVSYTWADADGDLSMSSNVICRGKTIPITKNCDAALRRLRLQSCSRRLWVDAICINQNDTHEKNRQVRLMAKIFMKASQVLAYLGVEAQSVTNGLQRIIDYLQAESLVTAYSDLGVSSDHINSLFELAYFDRVWILQEIGLGQLVTLIIGVHEVRWTGTAVSKMLGLSSAFGIEAPSILRWNPASRPEEEKDHLAVLSRGRNCSATDPRDKVYALMGLMHSQFSTQFGIDYSLSPVEVFVRLAVYCIDIGRFDVLQHVHYNHAVKRPGPSLAPTWVPFWDLKDIFDAPPEHFSQVDKETIASSWHGPHLQPRAWLRHGLPRHIVIKEIVTWVQTTLGTHTDRIIISTAMWRRYVDRWTELHPRDPKRSLFPEEIDHVAQQITNQQDQNFTYLVSERDAWSVDDCPAVGLATFKLPCLKLRAHRLDEITKYLGVVSNARLFCIPRTKQPALGSQHCQECIDAKASYFQEDAMEQARHDLKRDIEKYGAGKLVFETNHSFGFTRGKALLGDSIWALYGAAVPFILRKVDDHYHLVGDCYLYRAGKSFPCKRCGAEMNPWPMQTEIVDLW